MYKLDGFRNCWERTSGKGGGGGGAGRGGDFLMKDMGTNGNLCGGVLGFINLTSKIDHTPTQYGGILHAISTRHRCN